MRPSVRAVWPSFTQSFEGAVPFMYLDRKGLVTTAYGNLIDSPDAAAMLRWKTSSGSLATRSDVEEAWNAVKAAQDRALNGGGTFGDVTSLRLDADALDEALWAKTDENEATLQSRFPAMNAWPADAELAIHSMAWAMGPNFRFPKFQAAVNASFPDFRAASTESHINAPGDATVERRNQTNAALLESAAATLEHGNDVNAVSWSEGAFSPVPRAAYDGSIASTPIAAARSLAAFIGSSLPFVAGVALSILGGEYLLRRQREAKA